MSWQGLRPYSRLGSVMACGPGDKDDRLSGMILRKGYNSQKGGTVRMGLLCESTELTLFSQSYQSLPSFSGNKDGSGKGFTSIFQLSGDCGNSQQDRVENSRYCHGFGIPRILVEMTGFQAG